LDFNLAIRSLMGDFVALIRRSRTRSFCQIGISFAREWNELALRLSDGDPDALVCDADYTAFDGAVAVDYIALFADVASGVYADDKAAQRRILAEQLSARFSRHGTRLIALTTGMPSGCAITGECNSLANSAVLHLAYFRQRRLDGDERHPSLILAQFDDECDHVVYGDDLILRPRQSDFPLTQLFQQAAHYGFTATAGDKMGPPRLRPLFTTDDDLRQGNPAVAFLKMGFYRSSSGVVPLLDLDSVRAMLDYTRCEEMDGTLAVSLRTAEAFLSRYPRFYYDQFFAPYRAVAARHNLPLRFRDHAQASAECLDDFEHLTDPIFA